MDTILVDQIFEFVEYIIATGAMLRSFPHLTLGLSIRMLQLLDGARWPPRYFIFKNDKFNVGMYQKCLKMY